MFFYYIFHFCPILIIFEVLITIFYIKSTCIIREEVEQAIAEMKANGQL